MAVNLKPILLAELSGWKIEGLIDSAAFETARLPGADAILRLCTTLANVTGLCDGLARRGCVFPNGRVAVHEDGDIVERPGEGPYRRFEISAMEPGSPPITIRISFTDRQAGRIEREV